MHINKHSCSKFMLESRQLIYRYHMITCSQNLFLQEVRKSKILLGKAGILKDDEEEQEVNYMYMYMMPNLLHVQVCILILKL